MYFALSSGVSVLSSLPWNFTSCQDVPPSPTAAPWGEVCVHALQANVSTAAANNHERTYAFFTYGSLVFLKRTFAKPSAD